MSRTPVRGDLLINWEIALSLRSRTGLTTLRFVRNDGTNGVHNSEYAIAILDSVEADFKEVMTQLDSVW